MLKRQRIQACLGKNSYQESKCQAQIDALYECCNSFYARNGDEAKSVCCPQASLLRLKMKQRAEESSKR
ncbi:Cx9C motif-containing protein, mitochondrial [Lachnellula willkommii]|uniref:Cx9C motif-containing protein 4, mitochondrial n=1 Tax=Lachnellula willkommii TaxID=215461 RepID=A0A559MC06_9HELO|nr:Cx9C motif-containing protein, mitochondrial [Lachnellula willkommii]